MRLRPVFCTNIPLTPVLLRRAAVRRPRPRARYRGAAAVLRASPSRSADLFMDVGPVQPERQQGHHRDGARRDAHARRDPRQPDRAADRGARNRHARLHRDDLRHLRPPRPTIRPDDPRPRPPAPLPPRHPAGRGDRRAGRILCFSTSVHEASRSSGSQSWRTGKPFPLPPSVATRATAGRPECPRRSSPYRLRPRSSRACGPAIGATRAVTRSVSGSFRGTSGCRAPGSRVARAAVRPERCRSVKPGLAQTRPRAPSRCCCWRGAGRSPVIVDGLAFRQVRHCRHVRIRGRRRRSRRRWPTTADGIGYCELR